MDAKETIEKILSDAEITMTATHLPTEYDHQSKEWQHIAWAIELTSKRGVLHTAFKQGVGHLPNYKQRMSVDDVNLIKFTLRTGLVKDRPGMFTSHGKPIPAPHIADVVSSLLSDASAAEYAKFEEWANELGMNPDSRKDFATWEACRNTALELNRVFGCAVVESLRQPCQEL